jgi:hypothetical protein
MSTQNTATTPPPATYRALSAHQKQLPLVGASLPPSLSAPCSAPASPPTPKPISCIASSFPPKPHPPFRRQ